MRKKIIDQGIIKAWDTGSHYEVVITALNGDLVVHQPFPRDPKGLTCLNMLAADVTSGKYLPIKVIPKDKAEKVLELEYKS